MHRNRIKFLLPLCAALTILCMLPSEAGTQPGSTEKAVVAETETEATSSKPFRYLHDPMENPKAATDIVVNPDAVYGYSPNPESVRLGKFADALDWSDPAAVAQARENREEYLEQDRSLLTFMIKLYASGKSVEEVARAVSARRNDIRLEAYQNDPDSLARVKKSNLDTYGDENGPSADFLYGKYGDWLTILEKAFSTNPGMDACLGFYDENYDEYNLIDTYIGEHTDYKTADETETEDG